MEQEALTCSVFLSLLLVLVRRALVSGADPGIFERGGPEAIIYKILERGCPKSLKMAFECSFQSLSYKSFANIPQKGGAQAPWAPPLNPPLSFIVAFNGICSVSLWVMVEKLRSTHEYRGLPDVQPI